MGFDVLDLVIPTLVGTGLSHEGSAFGTSDVFVTSTGRRFARQLPVYEWYPKLAGDRVATWTLLSLQPYLPSERSGLNDYFGQLRSVMDQCEEWVILAEADCDQHETQTKRCTIDEALTVIQRQLDSPEHDLAVVLTSDG